MGWSGKESFAFEQDVFAGGAGRFYLSRLKDTGLSTGFEKIRSSGSSNSAIELTIAELEEYSFYVAWINVYKGWE